MSLWIRKNINEMGVSMNKLKEPCQIPYWDLESGFGCYGEQVRKTCVREYRKYITKILENMVEILNDTEID